MRTIVPSVIVDDGDVMRTIRRPDEADPKLSVNPNTVLPFPIAFKRLELVGRRRPERLQRDGRVEIVELPARDRPQRVGARASSGPRIDAVVDVFGPAIGERADRDSTVGRRHASEYNAYRYSWQALASVREDVAV